MLLAYRQHGGPKQGFEEVTMFTTEIGRKFATLVCTVLLSATCVAGAIGPATAHQTGVTTARHTA
jgi:hypothetical protein